MAPSAAASRAKAYAIEPVGAIPHASHVHALALSADGSTLLSGGADGHVRRYDANASLNSKNPLTLSVRHAFVEGVTRGGVLNAWWANEELP